jgi:hypothetical protein
MNVTGESHGESGLSDPRFQLIDSLIDLASPVSADTLEVVDMDAPILGLRPPSDHTPIDPEAGTTVADAVKDF